MTEPNVAPASPAAPSAPATPVAEPAASPPAPVAAEGAPAPSENETPEPKGDGSLLSDDSPTGDKGKPEQSTPAEIEVTLPEGTQVDEAMLTEFKDLAKASGLTSESATKLATWYTEQTTKANEAAEAQWAETGKAWKAEIDADPEIGGAKLEASVAAARKGVEWAGGEDLRAAITEMGLGNHPLLFKAFRKLGDALGDDKSFLQGAPAGGGKLSSESRLDKLYPTMNPDGSPKKT